MQSIKSLSLSATCYATQHCEMAVPLEIMKRYACFTTHLQSFELSAKHENVRDGIASKAIL